MRFVVLITSAGALPPSYAARPIISPSLGIDQRAGESQLWGRERAALNTSARSAQRLSTHKTHGKKRGEDEKMSHGRKNISAIWLVFEGTFCFLFSWEKFCYIDSFAQCSTYRNTAHNGIQSLVEEIFLIQKMFRSKINFSFSWSHKIWPFSRQQDSRIFCTTLPTMKQMIDHEWQR